FFFQAEDGIRDDLVTGVQTCALPISNCAKFSSGTATTLGSVTYQVDNHGKTKDVRPPKFMYWVKVTATAGSNTFVISQSITTGRSEERRVGKECRARWARVYDRETRR